MTESRLIWVALAALLASATPLPAQQADAPVAPLVSDAPRAIAQAVADPQAVEAPARDDMVAWPKFSPLTAADDAAGALARDGRALTTRFGAALPVLETSQDGLAVRVTPPDGVPVWLHRTDLLLRPAGQVVRTGPEFRLTSRPAMRIYLSHSGMADFLARGAGDAAAPDLSELHKGPTRFDMALPLLARDTTFVLGDRVAEIAQVMLPVPGDLVAAWQEMQGVAGPGFDIRFLVDASADAVGFTSDALLGLARQLQPMLEGDRAQHQLFLAQFSEGSPYKEFGAVDISALRHPLLPGRANLNMKGAEPVARALMEEAGRLRATGRAGTVLVVLTGAEIADLAELTTERLRALTFVDAIVLAQVTPELAPDLAEIRQHLDTAVETVLVEFGPGQARRIAQAIHDIIEPESVLPLTKAETDAFCATALALEVPCLLPNLRETAGDYPPPPGATLDPEWYGVTAWIVLDGRMFRHEGPDG